jgi:hypothetical protein
MHRWDTDPKVFKDLVETNSNVKTQLLVENEEFRLV